MLENLNAPELRRELTSDRAEALRRSAQAAPPGPLRLALGAAFVRIGHRLAAGGARLQPDHRACSATREPWGRAEA